MHHPRLRLLVEAGACSPHPRVAIPALSLLRERVLSTMMVNYPCSILGIALLLYCNLYAAHAYVEPLDVSVDENYILYLRFLMRAKNPPKNRSPYIKVVIDAIDFDRSKELSLIHI